MNSARRFLLCLAACVLLAAPCCAYSTTSGDQLEASPSEPTVAKEKPILRTEADCTDVIELFKANLKRFTDENAGETPSFNEDDRKEIDPTCDILESSDFQEKCATALQDLNESEPADDTWLASIGVCNKIKDMGSRRTM
eukprot:PLAT14447.1.p2 GENE.PLAT14447.1~~PLAT14447.1.p2  ORF type:complete len:140 (-),score=29.91 PLAT14447.1:166-585(-)